MSGTDGNVKVYLKVMVNGEEYLKTHFKMCFIKVPFDKLVQHIQDSARTRSDMPHFLAESITMTIDHQTYPFAPDTNFTQLIYGSKRNLTKAICLTMDATLQETKPPKLSHKIYTTASCNPVAQRSVSRGSMSIRTASTSGKTSSISRASTMTVRSATPSKKLQNVADLPAVPVSAVKPTPATSFISLGSVQTPEINEETVQNAEFSSSLVMPPPAPEADAENVIEAEASETVVDQEAELAVVDPIVKEVASEETVQVAEVSCVPAVQAVVSQSPEAAKKAAKNESKKKRSTQVRKKYKGQKTFKVVGDDGESEGYDTAEGSASESSDSDEEEEQEEEVVHEKVADASIAAPAAEVELAVEPCEEVVVVVESVPEAAAEVAEDDDLPPLVDDEQGEMPQQQENRSVSPVTSTETDTSRCKTPEKTRSLSNPRGGCRASASKATVSSISKNKNLSKRMSALASPAPLYNAGRGAVTYGEAVHQFESNLHRTTGSMFSGSSHAPFNPSASLGSATKMPRSTPAKKAAPAKSANSTTAAQELSPIRMSVPRSGRPSIGTIETQWEFMRSNFFNNDDEEIVWSMVSKKRGAYQHAHQKYQKAEDHYFQLLQSNTENDAKIDSLKTGLGAQIVAILSQLNDICGEHQTVGYTADVEARYRAALEKLKKMDETATEFDLGFSCFTGTFVKELRATYQSEDWSRDVSKNLRAGRKLFNRVDKEKEVLVHQLSENGKRSERALEYMEKWSRREKDALDYAETMRAEIEDWLHENYEANCEAYEEMRKFVPVNIWDLQVPQLMELSRAEGGCLSLELATEIKQNKLLHWIVTHPDDIATDSFLTGDKKAIFENLEALDIVEMRAIAYQLPAKFENDKDGKKNEWRARFFARVRQLAAQQQGVLVKGPFCLVKKERLMVPQPALKPEQQRRAVYFYRTKENSQIKIKQYTDRIALLARRENNLVAAKAAVQETKAEYDVLLQESRDPAFIKEYGPEMLTELKDVAKGEWQAALSTLKFAEQDLSNLRKTIEAMPLTFDEYKEQEAELVAFLANRHENPVDWNQRGLAAQPVVCEFDNSAVIMKAVKESVKFVSAEEEAAQRKADLEALLSRKSDNAAAMASSAEGDAEAARNSPVDFAAPFATAPGTPGAEDTASGADTATAPNTEFKKLSTAALGIFSPTTARSQSEYSLHSIATPFETPRKRNSVLMNANPEMLNTLNKMLMNSPAATPLKNSRQSLFGAASASKFALKNATGAVDADDNKAAAPEVKPVTRSKLLMRKLTPHSLMGGSSLSPKRSAPMPKLNFLAQLTSRAKAVNSEDDDATPATPSAAPAVRGPGGLGGAPRGPMGLFAEIARFRKPEADECAVEGAGKASTSAVSAVSGVSGESVVKGSEEGASGEKENSSALDNVEASKPVSSAFKKASSTSAIMGMGMMMGGPSGAMKMPMMSMFDEIRKRRVIE